MKTPSREIVLACLRQLLKPIVSYCLRHALSVQDIHELAKLVFVEAAQDELKAKGQKANTSRLSVRTGLRRREVDRLLSAAPDYFTADANAKAGLVTRVIGHWQQNKRYRTKGGKARVLSFGTEDSQFSKLVAEVSTDVRPGTVLRELEAIGAVAKSQRGLKLVHRAYMPKNNAEEGYRMLALDSQDLALAVEENVFENPRVPNLHATTEYDNISARNLPQVRKWLLKEGVAFQAKVRKYLAELDKDSNPRLRGEGGARVVLGMFSRVDEQAHALEVSK